MLPAEFSIVAFLNSGAGAGGGRRGGRRPGVETWSGGIRAARVTGRDELRYPRDRISRESPDRRTGGARAAVCGNRTSHG